MKLFGGFHGDRSKTGKKPAPAETEEKTRIEADKPAPKEDKLPETKTTLAAEEAPAVESNHVDEAAPIVRHEEEPAEAAPAAEADSEEAAPAAEADPEPEAEPEEEPGEDAEPAGEDAEPIDEDAPEGNEIPDEEPEVGETDQSLENDGEEPAEEAEQDEVTEEDIDAEETADEETEPAAEEEEDEPEETEEPVEDEDADEEEEIPEDAVLTETLVDEENPERKIRIFYYWNDDKPTLGGTVTFCAELEGYEGLDYSIQWQQISNNEDWTDLNSTGLRHYQVITAENYKDYWRIQITINGLD